MAKTILGVAFVTFIPFSVARDCIQGQCASGSALLQQTFGRGRGSEIAEGSSDLHADAIKDQEPECDLDQKAELCRQTLKALDAVRATQESCTRAKLNTAQCNLLLFLLRKDVNRAKQSESKGKKCRC